MNYEGQITGHRGWVTALACPQQTDSYIKVVSTSRDGTIMTWKANPNRHSTEDIYAIPDHRLEGHSGFVSGISLAHTSEYAITSSWDRSLRLWSLRTGQCQGKFLKHTKDVLAVAFSPEDRQIVSGGRDNVLRVWNVKGECVHTLERNAHTDWVSSICFSPSNSTLVVSGSWDNTVKVWDLTDSSCVHTLKGHTNYVTSVTVSPDGSLCASGGKDGVARLWDLNSGDSLFELNVDSHINQVAFSPNRFWLCVAANSIVRVYDLETKAVIIELVPDSESRPDCLCIAWSADGNTLYSGYSDNTIKVWSLNDSE